MWQKALNLIVHLIVLVLILELMKNAEKNCRTKHREQFLGIYSVINKFVSLLMWAALQRWFL